MRTIVFDLDGTLIDSAPDIRAAVNAMLADEGREALSLETVISFIGNGLPRLVELVMEARGFAAHRHPELLGAVLRHYNAGNGRLTRLYPGVRNCLENLHGEGLRLGLCTNKPLAPARDILRQCGVLEFFSTVIGGDSLPERKPHPAPLLAAFDGAPEEARLYVGDSEVDAETAGRAGVPLALFTEGYRKRAVEELSHAHAFDDFSSLPGFVTGFFNASAA